jgi:hypothetical protein
MNQHNRGNQIMKIPQFVAKDSIYKANQSYYTSGMTQSNTKENREVIFQARNTGLGTIEGTLCRGIACNALYGSCLAACVAGTEGVGAVTGVCSIACAAVKASCRALCPTVTSSSEVG